MMNRRRTFHFSPAASEFLSTPDGGTVGSSLLGRKTDLERKLELLEARFTMPLDQSSASAVTAAAASNKHDNNDNNSSPATLDPENSSPASIPSTTNTNANNNSQHSFGFGTPSLTYYPPDTADKKSTTIAQRISSSPLVVANANAFHPSRLACTESGGGCDWQEIATAHVAKQMALLQQQQQQLPDADSQDRTLLTSHVQPPPPPEIGAATHDKNTSGSSSSHPATLTAFCVQESPPLVTSNRDLNHNKGTTVVAVNDKETDGLPKTESYNNKRKSVMPVKRSQPSVKETTTTEAVQRKRTRLPFDTTTTTENFPEPKLAGHPLSPHPLGTITYVNKPPRSSSSSPLFRRMMNSNHSKQQGTEHSREPPSKSTAVAKKAAVTVTSNTKISDFFRFTKKSNSAQYPPLATNLTAPTTEDQADTLEDAQHPSVTTNTLQPRPKAPKDQQQQQQQQEMEELQQRCEELRRICQDKDEQLKAVSNNRTILHSALQTALKQREQELQALQQSKEDQESQLRRVLEDLVRSEACQNARELREKLAVDGARLGRIVAVPPPTTRGPPPLRMMLHHRAAMESWEDGHATKELEKKRTELLAKRTVLEERQKTAAIAEERLWKQLTTDEHNQLSEVNDDPVVVEGVTIRTALDVREAVESVRFHLDNLRRQEQKVAIEEMDLNDEKGAHIRALKRVASEDASRFRSRPKLHDRYVLLLLLGKGGFSEVWRAFDLVELMEVAVKIHQLDSRWPESKKENYTKHVSREYEIHRSVRHPRIVSLYDVFEIDNNSFATVLEACNGTDLDTLLKLKRRLPERDARAILLQILSGMNYLSHPSADGSRQGIIHYDLKPGNILFDEYGDAKITDFGLSKIVDTPDPAESMELTSQGAGTYWYLPPECFVLEANVRISNKVDVWSIGVIFYQMLFGVRPFGDGQSQDKILTDRTMLNAHTVPFPERPQVTSECKEFIRACLTYDQSFRPSIAQICQHPFVISKELGGTNSSNES